MTAPTSSIDWDYFLSDGAKAWEACAIRGLFPLEQIPGMVSLLAGKPASETFPITALDITVRGVDGSDEHIKLDGAPLETGLQYGMTPGAPGLVQWLEALQTISHNRLKDDTWSLAVGSGSQDLITKAFSCLCNPGDSVLIEAPVFAGTLGFLYAQPVELVEVATSTEGLVPESLEDILANWETQRPGKRFPKILYTIPTGSNPTGCNTPLESKEKVLALARKYNILILEDDAYHYLAYDVKQRSASYFEIEARSGGEVGQVIRFDTLSKILSSGMRLGFVTAAPAFIDKLNLHTSNTNLQPNSLAQAVAQALLTAWGHQRFIEHTQRVAQFYKGKRDILEAAAQKHLAAANLASWVQPDTGMFLYLRLNLNEDGSDGDSMDVIRTKAVARGVLAVPGVGFSPSKSKSPYVRVSYSQITPELAELAMERLRDTILEARGEL